jgi:hypothetical protein
MYLTLNEPVNGCTKDGQNERSVGLILSAGLLKILITSS